MPAYTWNHVGPWDEVARYILTRFPPPTEREKKEMATALLTASKAEAEAHIAELQALLEDEQAKLQDFVPAEPAELGSVIRFKKFGAVYTYAAIRAYNVGITGNGFWYLTQDGTRSRLQGHGPKSWAELLHFVGQHNWDSIQALS